MERNLVRGVDVVSGIWGLHGTAGVEEGANNFVRNWLAYSPKETDFLQALSALDTALQWSESWEIVDRMKNAVAWLVGVLSLEKDEKGFHMTHFSLDYFTATEPDRIKELQKQFPRISLEQKEAAIQEFQSLLQFITPGNPEVDASLHEVAIRVLQALTDVRNSF